MAYTLLEVVQSALASVGGDEVDTYDKTQESRQIANLAKDIYYETLYRLDPPEQSTLFELEASGDNTKPTIMYLPSKARSIEWIKYDNQVTGDGEVSFTKVDPVDTQTFWDRMDRLSTDETNVETFSHAINDNADTINFFCYNDRHPTMWTTFDDYTVVFDAYDSDEQTTLTKASTLVKGCLWPSWSASDTFEPELPESQWPLFINELKQAVSAEMRQVANNDARLRARRQWVKSQRTKRHIEPRSTMDMLPDYGRRRPG